jgi:hypothetical protein
VRELREHHAYWYGTAVGEDWLEALTDEEIATVRGIIKAALDRMSAQAASA